MAELDYAMVADFAKVEDDGALTLVGAHRATVRVAATPTQHVLYVAGRLFMARREPPALLSLGAVTPDGEVPVVAQWPVEPVGPLAEGGRLPVCFAVTLMAPVPAAGDYTLALSVNGDLVRRLLFVVVEVGASAAR